MPKAQDLPNACHPNMRVLQELSCSAGSNHFGIAGYYSMMAMRAGLIVSPWQVCGVKQVARILKMAHSLDSTSCHDIESKWVTIILTSVCIHP